MSDYADFLPKVEKMLVGQVELEVCEYTIAKRDAVLKLILSGLDVATLVKPFWDAAKAHQSDTSVDLLAIVRQLKDVVLRVLGNDLTTVSCVTLDTPVNRKKVAVLLSDPEVEKLELNSDFGYTFSPKMFTWLRDNLTARQEFRLVEQMLAINDFVGLIKNYIALASVTMAAAREKKDQPKKV